MWLHSEVRYLGDLPAYHARVHPERPALLTDRCVMTFAELEKDVKQIASYLRTQGIKRGERIAYLGRNAIEYFVLLFAVARCGSAIVPLNWRLAPPELAAVFKDARPSMAFVDQEFFQTARRAAEAAALEFRMVTFSSADCGASLRAATADAEKSAAAKPSRGARLHPDDTALLLYTSGTTGEPKGAELTHAGINYARLCEHLEPAFELREKDVMLCVMPTFHLVGTGLAIYALYNGVPVAILPAFDASAVAEAIERHRVTICPLVPTALRAVINDLGSAARRLSSLRKVIYAGSPISPSLLRDAMAALGCEFMQVYGATETCGYVTILRPSEHDPDDLVRLSSCGRPVSLVDVRIVDPAGADVAVGKPGDLLVRSPALFKGYFNKKALTREVLQDGWYKTGDIGWRDEAGFVYLVDRAKDMVISGGENVYSTEVERALEQHPGVVECAVIGLPDAHWGERVAAVVVARDVRLNGEELVAHCRTLIAGYKIPKQFIFVDRLPKTTSGKIKKFELRERYSKAGEAIDEARGSERSVCGEG